MRATIDINEELFNEAKKLTSIKTKKELINLSLEELIKKEKLKHLLNLYGSMAINTTLKDVEKWREDE
ncbi:type II toxin-antitoxin system VapB family antitoxin [Candidatus Poribacteria bacterium]|nr:type II toxin-antitoxin system VapB family antitoxin [Candidatus Poribacteria bacterium]